MTGSATPPDRREQSGSRRPPVLGRGTPAGTVIDAVRDFARAAAVIAEVG
ncbi:MAG TPA: hypothetical protein VF170_17750 [Planctomycetaceae bacterium]